jgi:hypothetical protein
MKSITHDEQRQVCAEAYQIVSSLAHFANVFESMDIEQALDNLSAAASGDPVPHKDLIPWPKDTESFQMLNSLTKGLSVKPITPTLKKEAKTAPLSSIPYEARRVIYTNSSQGNYIVDNYASIRCLCFS